MANNSCPEFIPLQDRNTYIPKFRGDYYRSKPRELEEGELPEEVFCYDRGGMDNMTKLIRNNSSIHKGSLAERTRKAKEKRLKLIARAIYNKMEKEADLANNKIHFHNNDVLRLQEKNIGIFGEMDIGLIKRELLDIDRGISIYACRNHKDCVFMRW